MLVKDYSSDAWISLFEIIRLAYPTYLLYILLFMLFLAQDSNAMEKLVVKYLMPSLSSCIIVGESYCPRFRSGGTIGPEFNSTSAADASYNNFVGWDEGKMAKKL